MVRIICIYFGNKSFLKALLMSIAKKFQIIIDDISDYQNSKWSLITFYHVWITPTNDFKLYYYNVSISLSKIAEYF